MLLRVSIKKRIANTIICLFFLLLICAPLFFIQPVAAQTEDEYYHSSFTWSYDDHKWAWNISIPKDLYENYKLVTLIKRKQDGLEGYGFLTTTKDLYIRDIATKLNYTANQLGYNSFDKISFVLAFVQSLPYTSDSVTIGRDDYPRFPIETLVDGGGDCEDTSILFSTLTQVLGYGTIYINPEGHYAVGVLGDNLEGTYWTYQNKTYYYCETTGDGFKIGELPEEYEGQSAYLYSMSARAQFIASVAVPSPSYSMPLLISAPTPSPSPTLIPTSPPTSKPTTNIPPPSLQPEQPTSEPTINVPSPTTRPDPTNTWRPTSAPPTLTPTKNSSSNTNTVSDVFPLLIIGAVLFVIFISIPLVKRRTKQTSYPGSGADSYPTPPPPPPSTFPPTQSSPGQRSKFCIHCGANNPVTAVYCERCGRPIG